MEVNHRFDHSSSLPLAIVLIETLNSLIHDQQCEPKTTIPVDKNKRRKNYSEGKCK